MVLQENSHRPNSRAFMKCIHTEDYSKRQTELETGDREGSERKQGEEKTRRKHDSTHESQYHL